MIMVNRIKEFRHSRHIPIADVGHKDQFSLYEAVTKMGMCLTMIDYGVYKGTLELFKKAGVTFVRFTNKGRK